MSCKQSYPLPQPSESFIQKFVEEYNKGNRIQEILVEYEEADKNNTLGLDVYNSTKDSILKINPKDNTISIRKVKDSWNKKEHISDLKKAVKYLFTSFNSEEFNEIKMRNEYGIEKGIAFDKWVDKWIKNNL